MEPNTKSDASKMLRFYLRDRFAGKGKKGSGVVVEKILKRIDLSKPLSRVTRIRLLPENISMKIYFLIFNNCWKKWGVFLEINKLPTLLKILPETKFPN